MSERYPLHWPDGWSRTPAIGRKRANFGKGSGGTRRSLTIAEAKERLISEIRAFTKTGQQWRIHPEKVVLSSNLLLNKDGSVRSGQKEPEDPGVAVYFTLDKSPCVLACDRWDRAADNIAAIAAHLCAMRGQERWGVGSLQQAFRGYAALPETAGMSTAEPQTWWQVLGVPPTATRQEVKTAYWDLSKLHHPDAGGDRLKWDRIYQAYEQAVKALDDRPSR